jgi:hypothetical protein
VTAVAIDRFTELDDLVLRLKGLVLVRNLLRSRGAGPEELGMFNAAIDRARDRLAEFAHRDGSVRAS